MNKSKPYAWPTLKLSEVLKPISRKFQVESGKEYNLIGVKWYKAGAHIHQTLRGENISTKALSQIKENDILYNKMWVTKNAFAIAHKKHDGAFGTTEYPQFQALPNKLFPKFMEYLFHDPRFQYDAHRLCKGSTGRARLNPSDFLKLEASIPPLPEQCKIAAILSTWDESVAKTEQLIAALQVRKKGLMQRLLSGEVRFAGFKTSQSFSEWRMLGLFPKDWDIAELGTLCEKIQDGNYGPNYPRSHEFVSEGIPFLTGKALSKSGIKYSKIDFITEEKHQKITKAHIKHKDVLFASRGNIGGAAIVPEELDGGNIGPQVTLVRVKTQRLHPEYLFYFFQSDVFKKQAYQVTAGSALAFFGLRTTSKFKIPIPSVSEQEKIAAVLQASDAEIELHQQKLAALKKQKQGLMQRLLTGAVRLKAPEN